MTLVPVLDVGGTHVSAALVDPATWSAAGPAHRVDVDSRASADHIVACFVRAAAALDLPDAAVWGVAMPDPFDYERGVALFHGVGKFEALYGLDVRSALLDALPGRPRGVIFCNDADAFTLGEWVGGAARGADRCVGLTLGTGVGSGWVAGGRIVDPGVPAGGRAHRLAVDGGGLEESMSRRAIRRGYARATGDTDADVREIAERARGGESAATTVLVRALGALGAALAPTVRAFRADIVVVGGSMVASWDLFEPWFRAGCGPEPMPPVVAAADPDGAALLGAAWAVPASRD